MIKPEVPTELDWGETSDRDIYCAFKNFNGKSNEETQNEYKSNIIELCENLSSMPIKPFIYYIFGLKDYIERMSYSELKACLVVDYFFSLIEEKSNNHQSEISDIYIELRPLLQHIAKNQNFYDADIDIYGKFSSRLQKLDEVIKAK